MRALQMPADEGRIGDDGAVVVDEGDLALGRRLWPAALPAIGEPRHFQLHFALHDEGAGIGQAEQGAKAEQTDHRTAPFEIRRFS